MLNYERIQEDEFDNMKRSISPKECKHHDFAKLYYLGSHTDYGCIHCGFKTLTPELFQNSTLD